MWYFLIKRYFMACTTEMEICNGFIADVVAIKEDRQIYEVEIKTSKADLRSELKSIKQVLSGAVLDHKEYGAKYEKHKMYITGKYENWSGDINTFTAANRFYFAIPEALKEVAIEGLDGSPYGVILLGKKYVSHVLKRAKLLHKNKISGHKIFKVIHRLSLENMNYLNDALNEQSILKSEV
jgi:hypothetical protein